MHNSIPHLHFRKSQPYHEHSTSDRKPKEPLARISPCKNLFISTSQEKLKSNLQNRKFTSPQNGHLRVQSDLPYYYSSEQKENETKRFEFYPPLDQVKKLEQKISKLEKRLAVAEKKAEISDQLLQKVDELATKIEKIEKYVCSMHKRKDSGESRSLGVKIKGATGAYIDEAEVLSKYFKNELEKVQKQFDFKLQNSLSDLGTSLRSNQFFKTNRKYANTPITLIYEQWIKNTHKPDEKHRINKVIYYMDQEGYLMDEESFYLVNGKGEKIRLGDKEISLLQKVQILH